MAYLNMTTVSTYVTGANDMRLQKNRCKYDLRKYCFTHKVINMWNSLPNDVVSAKTNNTFKIDWITYR